MMENDMEKLLRRAEPVRPSANFKRELLEKIAEIQVAPEPVISWRRVLIPLAAAAVILAIWLKFQPSGHNGKPVQRTTAETPAKPERYEPLTAETLVVGLEKSPVRMNDASFSRYRYRLVDRMEWKNPDSGERYSVTRPRNATIILCDNMLQ